MRSSLHNISLPALLCAVTLGCTDQPEPNVAIVNPAPVPIETSETPATPDARAANEDNADTRDSEPAQLVVYFGTFRDYLAAATYSESLRSAGLLSLNITRAKGGGELVVTDPMDESDARALAESLNGRLLSLDSLRRMTDDYGFLSR